VPTHKLAYHNAFATFKRVSFIPAQEGRHLTWQMPNDSGGSLLLEGPISTFQEVVHGEVKRFDQKDLAPFGNCGVARVLEARLCPARTTRADELYEGGQYRIICVDHGANESGKTRG
jgi:hypothetical protein